ncbi:type III effector protein [Ralstonia solanacearum]|uniref:type III effector protein n=1 Tax=Ralstonia solanacearum TaxID=305 RepID=UPI001FF857FC|nr:type III effector protein [Ralstonia solanacearum]MDB0527224.1 type III effector protein [Ralstonia solanacearum]
MKVTRNPPTTVPIQAPTEAGTSSLSSSIGIKRRRSSGTLADLPRPTRLDKRLRRVASDSRQVGSEVSAPKLQELIQKERAEELDVRFGSLQPVRTKDGDGIHSWELDAEGRPLVHPCRLALQSGGTPPDWTDPAVRSAFDIDALQQNQKRYIWAASAMGRVFIGEEIPVECDADSVKQRHQGHPLLVAGGPARICGEFQFDAQSGKLMVINKSGRYSRYRDRGEAHLQEVAKIIREAFAPLGLDIETKYRSDKTADALVLPSLDPRYRDEPTG